MIAADFRYIVKIRTVLFVIGLVLYITPIAFTLGYVGEKPVNIALSNILLIVSLAFVKFRRQDLNILWFPLYFILFGLFSFLFLGKIRIFGGMGSFVLPFLHLYVGIIAAHYFRPYMYRAVGNALSIMIILLVLSDLWLGNSLMRGCGYEGRWGGCLLGVEIYGFPNASMNYLAIMSSFLLFGIYSGYGNKPMIILAYTCLLLLCFLSLSRSSVLVLLIVFFSFTLIVYRAKFIFVVIMIVGMLTLLLLSQSFGFVIDGFVERMALTLERGDITNGRIGIWLETIAVIKESPIWGMGYLPFSEMSSFGTTHQQYLEVWYKTGLVGVLVYFGFLLFNFCKAHKYFYSISGGNVFHKAALYSFAAGVLVSAIFQSTITYQVLGNILFFSIGYINSRQIERKIQTI